MSFGPPEDAPRRRGTAYGLERELAVGVDRAFDTVATEEGLSHILERAGRVPGVVEVRDLTGPWDTPGSSRTVVLDNGRTLQETLQVWLRPLRLEYRVTGFGGGLGKLVDDAVAIWLFEPLGPRRSRFSWTYTFRRPVFWAPFVWMYARTTWGRYMEAAADRLVERLGG